MSTQRESAQPASAVCAGNARFPGGGVAAHPAGAAPGPSHTTVPVQELATLGTVRGQIRGLERKIAALSTAVGAGDEARGEMAGTLSTLDAAVLTHALQKTVDFEKEMASRFAAADAHPHRVHPLGSLSLVGAALLGRRRVDLR